MKEDKNVNALSEKEAAAECLAQEINNANIAYYQNDDPMLSDAQYDAAKRRLELLELTFPNLKASDSPSASIGAPASETFSKVVHAERMLSLSNAFDHHDVEDFDDGIRWGKGCRLGLYGRAQD